MSSLSIESSEINEEKCFRDLLQDYVPQLFQTSVKKFYRGFENVPPDYAQTDEDEGILITMEQLLKMCNPKLVAGRRHVLVVGPPGSAKSEILRKVLEDVSANDLLMTSKCISLVIDLRYFTEDRVMAFPRLIFNHAHEQVTDETAARAFEILTCYPDKALFVLIGLDTVPFDFESECGEIEDFWNVKISVVLHHLLAGKIFSCCKILSSCREYKARNLKGCLRPDHIIQVGELNEYCVDSLLRPMLGSANYNTVVKVWEQAPLMTLLNRTPTCFECNIFTGGMSQVPNFTHCMPMCFLNAVLCCLYTNHFPIRVEATKKQNLPVLHKVKKLAYYGITEMKYVFEAKFIEGFFGLSVTLAAALHSPFPTRQWRYDLLERKTHSTNHAGAEKTIYTFASRQMQEFLCALAIIELTVDGFKDFLREKIHIQRYYSVRRMICGLLLEPIVIECACRAKILLVSPKERSVRQKLLVASMSEEFRNIKRRDLLEFFYAVRDSGVGGKMILPKKFDVIDLSHIQLFSVDMFNIGMALASNIKVEHLNLSNCGITVNGIKAFYDAISSKTAKNIKITKFTLDWNTEWAINPTGTKSLTEIVKCCGVDDLSLNHCELFTDSMWQLLRDIDGAKISTLRIEHNRGLTVGDGYFLLGGFVKKQKVKDLYVSAKYITPKASKRFLEGFQA